MKRLILALTTLAIVSGAAFAETLKIYTEVSPPQQIQAPDGKLSGIAIDVVHEIQKRVGNTDPIQVVPWDKGYQEVQTAPNVVLFTMARTAERNPKFQWVGPIDESVYSLWVKTGSSVATIKSLEDAKKLRAIGVYKNDVRDLFLTKAGFANLNRAADNVTNVKNLMAGSVEAFAAAADEIPDLTKSAGCKVSDVKESLPLFKMQLYLAFSKGTPDTTVKAWSNALDELKKDKTFERIYRTYSPNNPLPGPANTNF